MTLGERRTNVTTRRATANTLKSASLLSKKKKATWGRCCVSYLLEDCILLRCSPIKVTKKFTINVIWKKSVPHPPSFRSLFFQQEK